MEFIYSDCLLHKVAKENKKKMPFFLSFFFFLEFPTDFDFQALVWNPLLVF